MRGRPVLALAVAAFPMKVLPAEMLEEILRGGAEKVAEAGAVVGGGHSIDHDIPLYGLSVTGIVEESRITRNKGARPGDALVLTKPLGIGVTIRAGRSDSAAASSASAGRRVAGAPALRRGARGSRGVMCTLNRAAMEAMEGFTIRAVTDVTGFGLLGHLYEMMSASDTTAEISVGNVPLLSQARRLVAEGVVPGGSKANATNLRARAAVAEGVSDEDFLLLSDAQTSGGLLVALPEAEAAAYAARCLEKGAPAGAVVGRVVEPRAGAALRSPIESPGPPSAFVEHRDRIEKGEAMADDREDWVEVASSGDDEEAEIIAGLLESEGFPVVIEGTPSSPFPEDLGAFGSDARARAARPGRRGARPDRRERARRRAQSRGRGAVGIRNRQGSVRGMSILPPGSRLGRFEISSVLGQGAMGVVYLAHDPDIDRPVAIKTIHPEAARGESAAEIEARFLKEAKLAGRLQHPNIVTVYDVGRDKDVYFIAMEYVEGKPLTRYLGGEELPLAAKVAIIRQAAEALAHAHEREVVHRDVKPGNILIAKDGRVKVTDFGIGKFTSATTSDMTRTGQMIGSPAYMSPEQIRGEKIDGRSDLFSLGVVLYELLTGARPFPGESITTLVYQILHTEPRDPREIRSDLPIGDPRGDGAAARQAARTPAGRRAGVPAGAPPHREVPARIRDDAARRRGGPCGARGRGRLGSVAAPPPLPTSRVPAPAPPPESASSGAPTAPAANRRIFEGTIFLLAGAALAGGLLFFLVFRKPRTVSGPMPLASLPTPASAPAVPTPPAPAPEAVPVEPTPVVLPTPGPGEAADATVGAPRLVDTPAARPTRVRPSPAPTPEPQKVAARSEAEPPAPPPASSAPARPTRVDAVYETRGSVRFTSSPEQARLYVDGHYVGIADDWDNRGGGRALELEKDGTHYVRMELPGYRPMNLQIDVTPDGDDSVSIDEELERRDRLPYEKLPAVYDRTTSEVEFAVTPADAGVSEDGKALGTASDFGPASPLKLSGPRVYDLMLSAPGYKPKLVRILVAPNAGKPRAKVTEKLKTP